FEVIADSQDLAEGIQRQQVARHVRRALQGLPADMRQVIIMKEYEGLKFSEIADILGIPISTVKTRMYTGLAELRKRLDHVRSGGWKAARPPFFRPGWGGTVRVMTDDKKTAACSNHEDLVSYLYGEVTPEQARRVETHLAGCSRCNDEIAAFRRVRTALQEWELNDMPIVRVTLPPQRRSASSILKELFGVAPVWAKIVSAGAAAMLLLAVMGTDITVGHGEFHFGTRLLGWGNRVPQPQRVEPSPAVARDMSADEIKAFVNKQIIESERAQKQALSLELARLEGQLKNTHSNDFAKLALRVQEQRDQLKNLQRDIDRREGLDVTDILFSSNGDRSRRMADNSEGGQ